ncbi:hypothetical protein KBD33_06040 [Candidatus Gracilibacteria bacterium]|nr:hypothetical protein [Candidatus Gracilibacteria bacterium]
MFIQKLDEAMESHRTQFGGKKSMNRLLMLPTKTLDDRFILLLELLTLSGTFSYGKIEDPENVDYNFDYNKLYKLLAEASMYVNNPGIVTMRFKEAIKYLSAEFIREAVDGGDFEAVSDVYTKKVKVVQFLTKKNKVNTNAGFAFKGKSGKVYDGKKMGDIKSLKQDELVDIIEGISGDPEFVMDEIQKKVLTYITANKDFIQSEFGNYRNALLAFLNWLKNPEIRYEIIVHALNELKIEHTYGEKSQEGVIAAKKAISKKEKA